MYGPSGETGKLENAHSISLLSFTYRMNLARISDIENKKYSGGREGGLFLLMFYTEMKKKNNKKKKQNKKQNVNLFWLHC